MKYIRLLATLVLSLIPLSAIAGTATLTWTAPTQNTDGTAIATPITYEARWGLCAAGNVMPASPTVNTNAVQPFTTPNLAPGVWCFDLAARTVDGLSVRTSTAVKTVITAPPNPPTGLTVSGPLIAYKMRQSVDGFQMVAIGTVASGTACDAAHIVNGYALIPRASVALTSRFDTLPLVTYAQCG